MKDKNIDKLFKDGLDERRIKPRIDSWSKIEAGLDSDSKKVTNVFGISSFMKFAAAFVTLIAALWIFNSDSSSPSKTNAIETAEVSTPSNTAKENKSAIVENESTLATDSQASPAKSINKKVKQVSILTDNNKSESNTIQQNNQDLVSTDMNPEIPSTTETNQSINEQDQSKPIEVKFSGLKLKLNKGPKIKGFSNDEIASIVESKNETEDGLIKNIFKMSKPIINSIADRNYNDIAIADK